MKPTLARRRFLAGALGWPMLAQAAGGDAALPKGVQLSEWPRQQPTPALNTATLQGEAVQLADLKGRVVLLNFWATWCPPCIREIPMLVEIQQELGEQGLQIVGIAVDKRDPARSFVHQLKVNYPVLYGVQSALEVSLLYGNDAGTLPHTAIVDRQGYIRHIIRGELEREQLLELVTSLL